MAYSERRFDDQDVEPPLTMDDRRRGSRARGPAPVTLIVSLLLLTVVAGGVFFMYRSGVRGSGQAPQPLGAPLGDVRAPAPPQPQTPDAAAGLTISKDDPNAAQTAPTLAPPPEQPLPEPAASTSAKTAAASPPPAPPPSAKAAEKPDAIDRLIAAAAKPKVAKAPASAAEPKLAEAKSVEPKPIEAKAAAKDAAKDSGGPAVVQIGAFSSEILADKEWSKAAAVAPGDMAGKSKRVVAVTKDGATLYRTSITGFASRDQARSLCDRLEAAGGSCFVR